MKNTNKNAFLKPILLFWSILIYISVSQEGSLWMAIALFLCPFILPLNLKANSNIIRGCDGWDNRRMEGEMDMRRITNSSHKEHWRMNQERRGSVMDCWLEWGINEREWLEICKCFFFFFLAFKTTRWSVAELNIKYCRTQVFFKRLSLMSIIMKVYYAITAHKCYGWYSQWVSFTNNCVQVVSFLSKVLTGLCFGKFWDI